MSHIFTTVENGFHIGNGQDSPRGSWDQSQQFIGPLEDLRLYSDSLSEQEVRQLYNNNEFDAQLNLLAHYRIDGDISPGNLRDGSTTGNSILTQDRFGRSNRA